MYFRQSYTEKMPNYYYDGSFDGLLTVIYMAYKDRKNNALRITVKTEQLLYMGDDIPDYDMLRLSAIGACPINAVPEIKKIADYISPIHGGKGCVRDVIEQVMKVQGKWTEEDDTASV